MATLPLKKKIEQDLFTYSVSLTPLNSNALFHTEKWLVSVVLIISLEADIIIMKCDKKYLSDISHTPQSGFLRWIQWWLVWEQGESSEKLKNQNLYIIPTFVLGFFKKQSNNFSSSQCKH